MAISLNSLFYLFFQRVRMKRQSENSSKVGNLLENLLDDLEKAQGEDIETLIRKELRQAQVDDDDDDDEIGQVVLSSTILPTTSKYKVGDLVYAKYYVDSLYYKAKVVSLSSAERFFFSHALQLAVSDLAYLVVFTEYGNEQQTYEQDIYAEEIALSLAEMEGVAEGPVCQECGWRSRKGSFYCDECGVKIVEENREDPEERAARIRLEITPWGTCKGCQSTIMMSDDVCLLCGLERGKEAVKRDSIVLESQRRSEREEEREEEREREKEREREREREREKEREREAKEESKKGGLFGALVSPRKKRRRRRRRKRKRRRRRTRSP